ncbi:MAG: hypothetical protein PUB22_08980 [Clostridiales bacterium]|nr:hypothetical protein [Clostridiales bacterium]
MAALDYGYYFSKLKEGTSISETWFNFPGDEEDYFFGYDEEEEKPYWVGHCDLEDTAEYATAEELAAAPIFRGKSLQDIWNEIEILSICGLSVEEWMESGTV